MDPVSAREARRVAIFHADWPLQLHTTNAAIVLAEAGYDVDLFLFRAPSYVDLDALGAWQAVRVHHLPPGATRPSAGAAPQGLRALVKARFPRLVPVARSVRGGVGSVLASVAQGYRYARGSEAGLPPRHLVQGALRLMRDLPYRCLIGVEKHGLLWAGAVAARLGAPLMYYSLELYTDDFQRLRHPRSLAFRRLRDAERRYHARAAATIIQDPDRARVLFADNRLPLDQARIFYVPVSALGPPHPGPSRFLHEALTLPREQRILLYFGQIHEERYALDLTRAAQTFPEQWTLVMHGWGRAALLDRIRALDRQRRVRLSLDMVPADRIPDLVASADVGLSFYAPEVSNDRLTAFASEKMAVYMQCGVPFVAFDYPGYRELALDEGAGRVIRSIDELREAVETILAAHVEYRRNALATFARHYDFARNFAPVVAAIGELS
jgi:glycosyltransferase involved in cell wall biosynthesis